MGSTKIWCTKYHIQQHRIYVGNNKNGVENTTYNNIESMWEAIQYDVENTTYNNIGSMCEAIKYGVPNTTYNSIESMWGTIKMV